MVLALSFLNIFDHKFIKKEAVFVEFFLDNKNFIASKDVLTYNALTKCYSVV